MRRTLAAACLCLIPGLVWSAPSPGLSSLEWLSGRWIDRKGGFAEEIWTRPEGDSMMGMWRLVAQGKTKIFEFTTIMVEEDGSIVMRIRHFLDRNTVSREQNGPISLTLVQQAEKRLVFEGIENEQKVRFTYALTDTGGLSFTLEKPSGVQQYGFEKAGALP